MPRHRSVTTGAATRVGRPGVIAHSSQIGSQEFDPFRGHVYSTRGRESQRALRPRTHPAIRCQASSNSAPWARISARETLVRLFQTIEPSSRRARHAIAAETTGSASLMDAKRPGPINRWLQAHIDPGYLGSDACIHPK